MSVGYNWRRVVLKPLILFKLKEKKKQGKLASFTIVFLNQFSTQIDLVEVSSCSG